MTLTVEVKDTQLVFFLYISYKIRGVEIIGQCIKITI
jgi:hypothetical protein